MTRADNFLTSPYLSLYTGEFNWLPYLARGFQNFFLQRKSSLPSSLLFSNAEKRAGLLNSRLNNRENYAPVEIHHTFQEKPVKPDFKNKLHFKVFKELLSRHQQTTLWEVLLWPWKYFLRSFCYQTESTIVFMAVKVTGSFSPLSCGSSKKLSLETSGIFECLSNYGLHHEGILLAKGFPLRLQAWQTTKTPVCNQLNKRNGDFSVPFKFDSAADLI